LIYVSPVIGIVVGILLILISIFLMIWTTNYIKFLKLINIDDRLKKSFAELKKLYDIVLPGKMKLATDLPD